MLRFLKFIDLKDELNELEKEKLLFGSKVIKVGKGEHLVKTGDEVSHAYFLLEGIVRYYVTTEDGREFTKAFYKDRFLIGSFDVIFNKIPNKFSVQCLTEVEVLKIPISNIRELLESSHQFSIISSKFITSIFIFKEKREIELLSTTASERLENFNHDFPELAGEISSVILASYLGISAIQLSRIKNKNHPAE